MNKFKFRVLSISTIVFSVLLSSLWASAQVAYTLKDEDVTIDSDGVITDCHYDFSANAGGTDLTIPSRLGGFEVKSLGGDGVFFNNKNITKVNLPEGLTSIGKESFASCSSLSTVTFPSSLTSIGDKAFYLSGLTELNLPKGLTSIGSHAFQQNSLTELTLPESVTFIGEGTFDRCKLTKLNLPEGLTSIGDDAFYGNQLTSVEFPESLTFIGGEAFQSNNLSTLSFPANILRIKYDAFDKNQLTSVVFTSPSNLIELGSRAFNRNADNLSIVLPQSNYEGVLGYEDGNGQLIDFGTSITNLDMSFLLKFADSYTLKDENVEVEDGIITSCTYHFLNSSIIIPENLDNQEITGIGESVFSEKDIVSVQLPSTLTTIGNSAFSKNKLTSLTIPSSVQIIGERAFSSNAITSLTIPSSVRIIASWAFYGNELKAVTFEENSNLFELGVQAFFGNLNLLSMKLPKDQPGFLGYVQYTNGSPTGTLAPNPEGEYIIPRDGFISIYKPYFSTLKITFNPNGGDGEDVVKTYNIDTDQTFPPIFTRDGYTLTEWSTKTSAGAHKSEEYSTNEQHNVGKDSFTLYAQWEPNESRLTYHPNYEGTAEVNKEENSFTDAVVTLLGSDAFSRDDYTLSGWSSDLNAQEATYEVGASFPMPVGGADLYAVWALNTDLSYHANYAGSSDMQSVESYEGEQVSLGEGTSFDRDGFVLTGWNTQENGVGDSYQMGESYTVPNGGMTFYAVWSESATVTFVSNYEESTSEDVPMASYVGEVLTLPGETFTRVGYTLKGWNAQSDGLGDSFALGVDYTTLSGGMTFYAVWEANEVVITYNANYEGSTNQDIRQDSKTDESVMLLGIDAFTRAGYTLMGWNTQPDGLGDSFALGVDYVTPSEEMTFYAMWEANEGDGTDGGDGTDEGEGTDEGDEGEGTDGEDETEEGEGTDEGNEGEGTEEEDETEEGEGTDEGNEGEGTEEEDETEEGEGTNEGNEGEGTDEEDETEEGEGTNEGNEGEGTEEEDETEEGEGTNEGNEGEGTEEDETEEGEGTNEGNEGEGTEEEDETEEGEGSTVLSLSDELNGSMMQSYPNPVQNMLTVERSKAMRGQVNVRVFNMVGKEVYSKVYGVSDDYMEVDFSALPMGMYFLQMSDENGDSERTRIMKN